MSHGQPRLLFLSLSDDVGSERIVAEMGRRGAVCLVVGRRNAVAAKARRVAHRRLPSSGGLWGAALGVASRLERLAGDWRPDAVVPLDDMAAGLLRTLATKPRTGAALRSLIVRSLGDPAHYATACCRALLIETAQDLGIHTPAQRRAGDAAQALRVAREIGFPLMLKREATCGGFGVTLVDDEAGFAEAFRGAASKARVKRAVRSLVGLGRPAGGAPITLQAHVAGRLAMRTVACAAGRVLEGVSLVAERLDPPVTGSSTVVRPLDHPEMETAARRVVAALGLSGFASFDFILSEDGRACLIEMNARPVGSGHLGARFGHDVYGAWLGGFPGFTDASPPAPPSAESAVALFPKELRRDPASPDLAAGSETFHDVPWDEPAVLACYRERLLRGDPVDAAAIARHLPANLTEPPASPRWVDAARAWMRPARLRA